MFAERYGQMERDVAPPTHGRSIAVRQKVKGFIAENENKEMAQVPRGPHLRRVEPAESEFPLSRGSPFPGVREVQCGGDQWNFTRLDAYIVEEDGAFCVRVRVRNHNDEAESAWGEEFANSIELATEMVNALTKTYSIEQNHVTVSIVIDRYRDGTFH